MIMKRVNAERIVPSASNNSKKNNISEIVMESFLHPWKCQN